MLTEQFTQQQLASTAASKVIRSRIERRIHEARYGAMIRAFDGCFVRGCITQPEKATVSIYFVSLIFTRSVRETSSSSPEHSPWALNTTHQLRTSLTSYLHNTLLQAPRSTRSQMASRFLLSSSPSKSVG